MDDRLARAHVIVSGMVQGVFFRSATKSSAVARGLTGWVKNLPDGKVEAVFEGLKPLVEEAVAWTHEGPPGSRVDSVDVSWEQPRGESSFTVR